jgi:UDP-glucose 4-epimerase
MKKVLITGIAGGQGQLVAQHLLTHGRGRYRVFGVDRKPWPGRPREIRLTVADIGTRRFEDVIRRVKPDAIIHLASVRHFRVHPAVRHEVNVVGTKKLIEFAVEHNVRQVIINSSSYVYGALPDNPYYMDESYPLSVSRTYPEIRDLAEMDMVATASLWQHPEVAIAVLRPVNVLGSRVRSSIGKYLQREYVPTVIGFNPMLQFIHEDDLAQAFTLALSKEARGTFNVAGPGAIPLHAAITLLGATAVPLPDFALGGVISRLFQWGLYPFPRGAIDFAKYQCTLDDTRFREATGFEPRYSLTETFAEAHV